MPLPPPTVGGARGGAGSSGSLLEDLPNTALNLALSGIEVPLEILSRPAYALSEAAGATRAGGGPLDVLGAGWRGLSGGRRKYPSLGEQLSPESKGLATGIDLLADPLLFLPSARLTRAGIQAARGTRAGKALLGGAKKLSTFIKEKEATQKLARLVLPLRSQLNFGGRYGKAIAGKIERAINGQSLETARRERSIIQEIDRLGLDGEDNRSLREAAALFVDSGGVRRGLSTGNQKVDEFAQFLQREFEDAKNLVQNTGLFPDFKPVKDYFPQMLKTELIEALERGNPAELRKIAASLGVPPQILGALQRSPSMAVDNLAKMLQISKEEAENLWRFNTGRPMKAGHIELPRNMRIPKPLLELDPLKVYPRYMNQLNRRVAYAMEFGGDFEHLDKLLEGAKRSGMLDEIAADIRQAVRDPISPEGKYLSKDFARKLLGTMTLTKMGPTSTIANLSQSINTLIVDGGSNFVRGLFRSRNPQARAQAVVSYHHSLKDHLEQMIGAADKPTFDIKGLRWLTPQRYLSWVGFTPVETMNRILAANSGVVTAERLAKEAVQAGRSIPTKELVKRGVKLPEFRYFQKFGKFSDKGTEFIGLKAANRTQHATNYLEIPLGWRTPEARVFTQYKSFIYQQSKFIHREIMKPAFKYFATDGKEGSIAPLLRAAVAFGVGGEVVAGVRQLIRGDKKQKFDASHPLSQIMRDASYVGAFGMASDIVDSALRGKIGDYFIGPTLSESFDVASGIARFLKEPEIPSPEDVGTEIYKRIGRGPLPFLNRLVQ